MDINEIKKKISDFLMENLPNHGLELNNDTDLLNEWFLDSFGVIDTILFLEETFDVTIKRSAINADNFSNINTISAYVLEQLK